MILEGVSGFLQRELPVDENGFLFSLLHQSQNFALHLFKRRNAAVETLTRQGRELNLNHVEPGRTLGGEVKLKTLS